MIVQANLESVLNNINKFINIDVHRQQYAEHFSALRDIIFNLLRKNKVFCYIFNGFQLGGSYGDNVKVSIPNEFDLVFHITFPEQSLIKVIEDTDFPGNVFLDFTNVIKKISKEKQHVDNLNHLKKWLDENNFLLIEKFQLYIQSCFRNALLELNNEIHMNGKTSSLSYKRQGPAHTIYVRESVDFEYSVDFVPGILLAAKQAVIPNINGNWEAIPKPSKQNHYKSTSFRVSYYRQEQNIIKDKKQLKNVYRMVKKFRDTKTNMKKMKSYYIKTLFLYRASRESPDYWKKPLTEIILDMFSDMAKSLQDNCLPFFWNKSLNLYDNFSSKLMTEMLSCVENSRKILEIAATKLTIHVQNRVYRIFLDGKERELLEQQSDIVPNILKPKQIEDDVVITTETATEPPESSNQWRCVIC